MIEAVIFDMDGLLVDSEPVWDRVRASMTREAGVPWTAADHQALMGVSTDEWASYMIEHLGLAASPQEVIDEVVERMRASYRAGIPWLPGALEAVALADAHYRTALASGSHPALIETVTADPDIAGRFAVIVAADEVGRGKPEPDVYLATAARLGVAPERCACIEDSGNGIVAGARAGMHVIAVPDPRFPPAADKLAQAELVLTSLLELSRSSIDGLGG